MIKELKKEIINWIIDNGNEFQRINTCIDKFRLYIYDTNGNYLIGGENVANFIKKADRLIYGDVN